jgi:hypothetical protein
MKKNFGRSHECFTISEPMFYFRRKYILFSFVEANSIGGGSRNLVIMKKN